MTNISTSDTAVLTQMDATFQSENLTMGEISRRQFLTGTSKFVLGGALAGGLKPTTGQAVVPTAIEEPSETRPNIILILNDQERYPQHWPAGWVEKNLPNHQRLTANGLTFRRSFCNTAMCSPSRATLCTGLHPAQHTVIRTLTGKCGSNPDQTPPEPTLPQDIQTMGRMLATAGYNMVLKGKWHMTMTEDNEIPSSEDVASYGFNDWEPTAVADDTLQDNFGGGCADWDNTITGQALTFLSAPRRIAVEGICHV